MWKLKHGLDRIFDADTDLVITGGRRMAVIGKEVGDHQFALLEAVDESVVLTAQIFLYRGAQWRDAGQQFVFLR